MALRELGIMLNIPDDKFDDYIIQAREKFMIHEDLKISEALPKIVEDINEADLMLGLIIMTFASDFYFSEYFRGCVLDDNR